MEEKERVIMIIKFLMEHDHHEAAVALALETDAIVERIEMVIDYDWQTYQHERRLERRERQSEEED